VNEIEGAKELTDQVTRPRFCVRCRRRVDLEADIGAVELTTGEVMCGADVDKLIEEIYVPSTRTIPWQQQPARFDPHARKDWW
jgi:hypothetical protein